VTPIDEVLKAVRELKASTAGCGVYDEILVAGKSRIVEAISRLDRMQTPPKNAKNVTIAGIRLTISPMMPDNMLAMVRQGKIVKLIKLDAATDRT
jgi:hypothetical protein